MIERRQHARTTIQCHVMFESGDAHQKTTTQDVGLVINISDKGLLLESGRPIYAATVRVIVPTQGKKPIRITGDVVYSIPMPPERYHTGIVFHSSEEDSAKWVEQLMHASQTT
jgi:PilZ domain-containing protein